MALSDGTSVNHIPIQMAKSISTPGILSHGHASLMQKSLSNPNKSLHPGNSPSVQPVNSSASLDTNGMPAALSSPGISSGQDTSSKLVDNSSAIAYTNRTQELARLKVEHYKLKQIGKDSEANIVRGKDRVYTVRAALDKLDLTKHDQKSAVPVAQQWLLKTISAINNEESYAGFTRDGNLSKEFCLLVEESKSIRIDRLTEVHLVIRVIFAIAWTIRTVSLLHCHPSYEELTTVVQIGEIYEVHDFKALQPIYNVLHRMEAWKLKAEKCMQKSVGKKGDIGRLQLLLKEYAKLPLTWSWVTTLVNYIASLSSSGENSPKPSTLTDEKKKMPEKKRKSMNSISKASRTAVKRSKSDSNLTGARTEKKRGVKKSGDSSSKKSKSGTSSSKAIALNKSPMEHATGSKLPSTPHMDQKN